MATRGPAAVSRSVRALGAAVHDLMTGRHEPNEPRGSRSDLWGAAGEIPAAYPAGARRPHRRPHPLHRVGPAGNRGSDRRRCAARAAVSYTHLRAHETPEQLVCRLLLETTN